MCAGDPAKVKELNAWLKKNATLKGTPLQDAAVKAGFEPSFVALVLFPDIVNMMAVQQDWTTRLGQAFAADRSAVFSQHSAAARAGAESWQPEGHAAAGSGDEDDLRRRTGDRHRAFQPASRVRAAVQPDDGLRRAEQQQRRQRGCGGGHRVHGGHRDRRGHRQRLLLRPVRVARRRVHVQRRVGRLLRPPRRRARGLDRPPRGSVRGADRPSREYVRAAHRPGRVAPGKPSRDDTGAEGPGTLDGRAESFIDGNRHAVHVQSEGDLIGQL